MARSAEQSLRERQAAVGKGFACRILLLCPIFLYYQTRMGMIRQTGEFWYLYLLAVELIAAVCLFRLNWRYYTRENGAVKPLLVPDLLTLCCVCVLPRLLSGVPHSLGLLAGQISDVPFLVMSVKAFRLHDELPWKHLKWRISP